MPPQNQPSPFEITTSGTSKKGGSKGIVVAVMIVLFLILSVVAGVLLVRQRQQIAEKAAVAQCPGAQACPAADQPTLLRNCNPPESDNSPSESLCNTAGRVEICGSANFCCPAPGASWTTNMTACNALAATPSPTPSPTPTVTPSPTPTPVLGACNSACTSNSNCDSGFVCSGGSCRNPLCTSATSCTCVTGTATPSPTSTAVARTTPRPIPETGIDWPTSLGIGVGAAAIILSILIAL